MKTLYLTDAEMSSLRDKLRKKYPWIQRENTIYSAKLVSVWVVKIDEEHYDSTREI